MIRTQNMLTPLKKDLSDLPYDILVTIVAYLPLHEAAKTSILSKKWRYIWTTIPNIHFDSNFLEYITNNGSLEEIGFENIINSIIYHSGRSPHIFELCFPNTFPNDNPDFDKWILFLSKNSVKKLTIRSLSWYRHIPLPSHIFSCKNLRFLSLTKLVIESPTIDVVCFKNLTSITLDSVQISNAVFKSIISSALHLESLAVTNCKGLDQINVTAPSLRYFSIYALDLKTINFSEMPVLEHGKFSLPINDNYSEHTTSLATTAALWPGLKSLELGRDFFKVIAAGRVPEVLPTKFNHLKRLTLFCIEFCAPYQFYSALCLIKSSLNLQELKILFPSYERDVIKPITKFMEAELDSEAESCSLSQLKAVKISLMECACPDLMLIQKLLRISPVLETISIYPMAYVCKTEFSRFKLSLDQSHRASPQLRFTFITPGSRS